MPTKREQFRKVADEMLIAVAEFDLDYKILYMNEAALKLLQMDEAALEAGAYVDDFLAPEQIALVHEGLKRLAEGME